MERALAVVGTAGHIDHGKTALVRRLTGVDTDRLKEEKERGISIDLGFAPLVTPAGRRVGIVDVPGHERFVRNMLAGVGGIDAVLLVVAADEGVMPQTREHFAIVKLLEVARGMVVLTKSQLARGDWVLAPGSLAASTLLTARVDLLKDAPRPLAHRARVRFHLGSGEALGRVLLLEGEELAPGESALAQLLLETPVVPARGDRFVLRAYSPMRTLGGGTVLEPSAERRKRGGGGGLDVEETGSDFERVAQALA